MDLSKSAEQLFTQVRGKGNFRILETVANKARLFDGNVDMGMQFLFI